MNCKDEGGTNQRERVGTMASPRTRVEIPTMMRTRPSPISMPATPTPSGYQASTKPTTAHVVHQNTALEPLTVFTGRANQKGEYATKWLKKFDDLARKCGWSD